MGYNNVLLCHTWRHILTVLHSGGVFFLVAIPRGRPFILLVRSRSLFPSFPSLPPPPPLLTPLLVPVPCALCHSTKNPNVRISTLPEASRNRFAQLGQRRGRRHRRRVGPGRFRYLDTLNSLDSSDTLYSTLRPIPDLQR
jgi:hypothetical protein